MHWLPIHLSPICISFIRFFHALSFICFPMRNKQWNACATSLWFCFSFYCFCAFFFSSEFVVVVVSAVISRWPHLHLRLSMCVCHSRATRTILVHRIWPETIDGMSVYICLQFVCVFFCCWSNNVCECTILLITVWQEQQQQKHTHTNNNNKKWKRIIFISVWFGSRLHSVSHIILIFPLNTTNWIITRPLCIIAKQWNDR